MTTILNNFFHSVFITEDTSTLPTAINMFRGSENEKLIIIGEISEDDIAKQTPAQTRKSAIIRMSR